MSEFIVNTVTYEGGCQTCVGLGIQWSGTDAKARALHHARQTGHKGIWYNQMNCRAYDVTEALTMEDWDEMERNPPSVTPPILITNFALGQRIRAARRAAGLTQAQLAEKMSISRPLYIAMEQGARQITYNELCQIAQFLNVSPESLIASGGAE